MAAESLSDQKLRKEIEKLSLEIREKRGSPVVFRHALSVLSAVSAIVLAGIATWAWLSGRDLIPLERRSLELARAQLTRDLVQLEDSASNWAEISRRILDEPSGLAPTNLTGNNGSNVAIAVDDESEEVFLLQAVGTSRVGVSYMLRQDERDINDMESACFDGTHYYLVGSHREITDEDEMMIHRFSLEGDSYQRPGFQIEVEPMPRSETWLSGLERAFDVQVGSPLIRFDVAGSDTRVNGRAWRDDDLEDPHRYPFEIEGATCGNGRLWLGLLYPTDSSGNVVVLEHDLSTDPELLSPSAYSLELPSEYRVAPEDEDRNEGGYRYGISAMAFDSGRERLIVGISPSAKLIDSRANGVRPADIHGRSAILWYEERSGSFRRRGVYPAGEPGTKLEGLAVVGDDLWLAFEGEVSVLRRIRLVDLY